jgi:hypothetical protein
MRWRVEPLTRLDTAPPAADAVAAAATTALGLEEGPSDNGADAGADSGDALKAVAALFVVDTAAEAACVCCPLLRLGAARELGLNARCWCGMIEHTVQDAKVRGLLHSTAPTCFSNCLSLVYERRALRQTTPQTEKSANRRGHTRTARTSRNTAHHTHRTAGASPPPPVLLSPLVPCAAGCCEAIRKSLQRSAFCRLPRTRRAQGARRHTYTTQIAVHVLLTRTPYPSVSYPCVCGVLGFLACPSLGKAARRGAARRSPRTPAGRPLPPLFTPLPRAAQGRTLAASPSLPPPSLLSLLPSLPFPSLWNHVDSNSRQPKTNTQARRATHKGGQRQHSIC